MLQILIVLKIVSHKELLFALRPCVSYSQLGISFYLNGFFSHMLKETRSTSYLPITVFNKEKSQDTLAQMGLAYISVLYVMVVVSVKFYLELCLRLEHGCQVIWGIVSLITNIKSKNVKSFSVVSRNICTMKIQPQGKC